LLALKTYIRFIYLHGLELLTVEEGDLRIKKEKEEAWTIPSKSATIV
jgi:hypothetical protein